MRRRSGTAGRSLRYSVGVQIRAADPADLDALARLWYDGWRDVHVALVPAALTALRTLDSFRDRMRARLADVSVVTDPSGTLLGFFMLKNAELYQFYVAAPARGTGLAATLMAAAEARLRERRITEAHLGCAIGNDRAARFYEKSGWRRTGVVAEMVETSAGPFELEVWRYEKALG
jgi:GNAT superfamily N-acetyltransferase